jgi:Raf kinase inhibitor-like YbhB/YbcL family protein
MRTALVLLMLTGLTAPSAAMQLSSPDLKAGGPFPVDQVYTRCGGRNISPELAWSGAPAETQSFALTLIDLSVRPAQWSHWIVIDIPPQMNALGRSARLPPGARALISDFGDANYDGPCPPAGSGVHHYRFTLWAMPSAKTTPPDKGSASDLSAWLAHRAIASASLTADFER